MQLCAQMHFCSVYKGQRILIGSKCTPLKMHTGPQLHRNNQHCLPPDGVHKKWYAVMD